VRRLGRAFAATTDDGAIVGVVGVCTNCVTKEVALPRGARRARYSTALERALREPEQYFAAIFHDPATADFVVALLGHPEWADDVLVAIGWREPTCKGQLAGANLTAWEEANGRYRA
jgi:hypothetical protein